MSLEGIIAILLLLGLSAFIYGIAYVIQYMRDIDLDISQTVANIKELNNKRERRK